MKQQSELCKARSLYISRGILNENIISKTIMHSWVRSKLHHISFENLNCDTEIQKVNLTQLSLNGKKLIQNIRDLTVEHSVLYLLNDDGLVLFNNNKVGHKIPELLTFSEEVIGTTAGGISINTLENAKVFGCEHYNQVLTQYITETLVINDEVSNQKYMILLLTPIRYSSHHDLLFSRLEQHYAVKEKVIKENQSIIKPEIKEEKKKETNGVNPVYNASQLTKQFSEEPGESEVCKVFTLSVIERETIIEALSFYQWNLKKTSEALGIGRSTLYRKIKEYSISK